MGRTIGVGLVAELTTRETLLYDVNQALALYVVFGPPTRDPLASLAQSALCIGDDPAWRRAVADRLAAKLGMAPGDLDKLWPAAKLARLRAS